MYLFDYWSMFMDNVNGVVREQPWQQVGIINYYVEPKIAEKVFDNMYFQLGTHIQVSEEQYNDLINTCSEKELIQKIKDIAF